MFLFPRVFSCCLSVSSNFKAVSLSITIPHDVHRTLPMGFLLPHLGQLTIFAMPASLVAVFSPWSSSMASSRSRAEKCTYRLVILLPYVQPANCSRRDSVKTLAMAVRDVWRYRYGHMSFFRPASLANRLIFRRKCW